MDNQVIVVSINCDNVKFNNSNNVIPASTVILLFLISKLRILLKLLIFIDKLSLKNQEDYKKD